MWMLRTYLSTALAVVLSWTPAQAQDAYPGSKPVHVVIAFGPGTGGDFLARLVAERLSEQMNAKFVVDNRPGAGGATGTKQVADAAPDGHTLLLGSNATLIINPTVTKSTLYNGETDFAPIGTVARAPMLLVTAASDKAPKTLAELVGLAKTETISYSSTGAGAFGHLTSELMLRKTGIKATHIPYKSSAESLTDVMRGEVMFANDLVAAALPHIKGNRLRGLAVTGPSRVGSLPDVPTFSEAGVQGMDITVWYCLMAPAGTPRPIIERLDRELARMNTDPNVLSRLKAVEFDPFALDSMKFKPFMSEELKFWRQFVADSGN